MNFFLEKTKDMLSNDKKGIKKEKDNEKLNENLDVESTKKLNDNEKVNNKRPSFGLGIGIFPDFSKDNNIPSINNLFKLIPSIPSIPSIPFPGYKKDEEEDEKDKSVIVLDNTDESLLLYQQKMIDLMDENKLLKNQIKEYVSKVAWLEESFTQRQENANSQHLQELEHIRIKTKKEIDLYNEKISELEEEINILQNELTRQTDILADEKDTLSYTTNANWNLEKKIEKLKEELNKKNSENINLKSKILQNSSKLEEINEKFKCLEEESKKLINELESTKEKNEFYKKENTLLNEKLKIYDNIKKRTSNASESSSKLNSSFESFGNLYSNSNINKTNSFKHTSSEYSYSLYPTSESKNQLPKIMDTVNNNNNLFIKEQSELSNRQENETEKLYGSNNNISNNIEDQELNELIFKISSNNLNGENIINKKLNENEVFDVLTENKLIPVLSKKQSEASINTMTDIKLD